MCNCESTMNRLKATIVGEQVKALTKAGWGTEVPLLDILARWQRCEDKAQGFDYELRKVRTKSGNPELIRVDELSMMGV